MEIQIVDHALRRARERGASRQEIEDTVRTGEPFQAKLGRQARWKTYPSGDLWMRKRYGEKRVEAFFLVEDGVIIVYYRVCDVRQLEQASVTINYDPQFDLLYIRIDAEPQPVTNVRVDDDIVLDMGEGDRLVGIEILGASKRVKLDSMLPVTYEKTA